jgi:hypothetical protein
MIGMPRSRHQPDRTGKKDPFEPSREEGAVQVSWHLAMMASADIININYHFLHLGVLGVWAVRVWSMGFGVWYGRYE